MSCGESESVFIELLFVVLLFEILYESNLRMPQYFGMAMSIVGALILGEVLNAREIVGCILMISSFIIANTKVEQRF